MNEQELKSLWKAQPVVAGAYSPHQLERAAATFRRKILRRNRLEYAAGVIVIAGFSAYVWLFPQLLMRIGSALIVLGTLIVLDQLHRRASSRELPPENLGMPVIAYYREELMRQRDALRSVWLWYVSPFVPGTVVFMWGQMGLVKPESRWAVPFVVAAIFIGVAVMNRYGAQKLQRKIDRLDQESSQTE